MKKLKHILLLLVVSLTSYLSFAQTETAVKTDLENKLSQLFPGVEITKMKDLEGFKESYQLVLNEPLDHKNPKKGTFKHYIYLSHIDFNSPMVIETEGYAARYTKTELSSLLNANQVIVEYRFYGKSRPNPIPWEYLTNDQAIADYHNIVTKLKQLYTGKWISTGISKGGETTLIYKSKYPKDIDVAVPYVAPLINTQEDPRIQQHLATVGTAECREKIVEFQRALLQNRTALLNEIKLYAAEKEMTFTEVSMDEALEYAALEFPFSFWQWGGKCEDIPSKNASSKELFDYMNKIVGISFYCDKTFDELLPSYYQHMSELGYYGFDFTPVKDLLTAVKSTSNSRFAPKDVQITYNPKYIKKVREYVENKGSKILYIYGGYDTWGACSPTPNPSLDALKMVNPGGSHATRIKNFPEQDQEKIMKTLEKWLTQ
ncbi:S28 family serine protease [Flavobacterium sp. PS2]|uniref:S28 family serine protease n=1 Tax=Flavobacterium sp. PS2 TaxID=3384157 RepID=UPI00390C5519